MKLSEMAPAVAAVATIGLAAVSETADGMWLGSSSRTVCEREETCGHEFLFDDAKDIFRRNLEGRVEEFCGGKSTHRQTIGQEIAFPSEREVCEGGIQAYVNGWPKRTLWSQIASQSDWCGAASYNELVGHYITSGEILNEVGIPATETAICVENNIERFLVAANDLADCVGKEVFEEKYYPGLRALEE
jgi:hypothetical protein